MKNCVCCNVQMNDWECIDVSVGGAIDESMLPEKESRFSLCVSCGKKFAIMIQEIRLDCMRKR